MHYTFINQQYMTKLGKSLISKFPRDQDERLWKYIRNQVLDEKYLLIMYHIHLLIFTVKLKKNSF